MAADTEAWTRYIAPINPAVFPQLSALLLLIGVFFTAYFFVYEVTSDKPKLKKKEILISIGASIFSAFGILFLLLSVGIYV